MSVIYRLEISAGESASNLLEMTLRLLNMRETDIWMNPNGYYVCDGNADMVLFGYSISPDTREQRKLELDLDVSTCVSFHVQDRDKLLAIELSITHASLELSAMIGGDALLLYNGDSPCFICRAGNLIINIDSPLKKDWIAKVVHKPYEMRSMPTI